MKKILLFATMISMFAGLNAGKSDLINATNQQVWVAYNDYENSLNHSIAEYAFLLKAGEHKEIPKSNPKASWVKTISVANVDFNGLPGKILVNKVDIDWTHSAKIENKNGVLSVNIIN